MKRFLVPGVPFLVSLALSLSTAGSRAYWQDSGFFLVAVKELSVLYPPGYALYVLLCKAWTLALGWVDFTYAVHLFSAFCAALAAGTIGVAARDLLGTKGPLFRTLEDAGPRADGAGMAVGVLAAAGYTFWSAAILAKVYAFYFLVLSLLLWRMIRADETRRPRDFTIVAALIGLAWQAHPSATNAGLALALFTAFHYRAIGPAGLAGRIGLAAACALGPLALLPAFARGDSALRFGDPRSAAALLEYVTGRRFTGGEGAFGLDGGRAASVIRYFWEEFLGVGLVLVGLGTWRLWTLNRRLLLGVLCWVVPVVVVTTLFKLEGQHDLWLVAAWIPLWLVAGLGLAFLGARREVTAAVALAGLLWAAIANQPDLDQRRYTLSEAMGHLQLDAIDPDGILLLYSDDTLGAALALQRVKGVRPDVLIVQSPFLGPADDGGRGWYESALLRLHPDLKAPDYRSIGERGLTATRFDAAVAAFVNANASRDRSLFLERAPGPELLRPDWTLVPAGHLLKLVPRDEQRTDPKYWKAPVEPESLPGQYRRERGQYVGRNGADLDLRPEAYERRLLRELLRARKNLADWRALSGTEEGQRRCAELYESILALDPWMKEDPGAVVPLARSYFFLKRYDLAEPWLKKSLGLPLPGRIRGQICLLLAEICSAQNRPEEATRWREQAEK